MNQQQCALVASHAEEDAIVDVRGERSERGDRLENVER